ncbi:hypothetical protein OKZ62_004161 [Vibrio navarrensis]|nr:hypothetical protein [Vibrio navarrensis]
MKNLSVRDIPALLFAMLFFAFFGLISVLFILCLITYEHPDSYLQMSIVMLCGLLGVNCFASVLLSLHDSISDRLFSSESSKASEQERRA